MNIHNQYKGLYKVKMNRKDLYSPTPSDIKQTERILSDFGIDVNIPKFTSKNDLYNWRNRVIRGIFDE